LKNVSKKEGEGGSLDKPYFDNLDNEYLNKFEKKIKIEKKIIDRLIVI
jgi:hypothetical protein